MMMALSSSETSVLARATQPNIPEDGILQIMEQFPSHLPDIYLLDRFCGIVVRVPGYRSRGPGPTRFSEK
jgi:hypothetical protein